MPTLTVTDLWLGYGRESETRAIIRGASFIVAPGESLALVGASGSGKTTLAKAIAGLLPLEAWRRGSIECAGANIVYCVQENANALNPALKIGSQLTEVIRLQQSAPPALAVDLARDSLAEVGFSRPDDIMRSYPHRLSGGMRQRVLLAMALSCSVDLLIADEVTAGLDKDGIALVTSLIARKVLDRGATLILITHQETVAERICQRSLELNEGILREGAPSRD